VNEQPFRRKKWLPNSSLEVARLSGGSLATKKHDGSLWAGKGYECSLAEQVGEEYAQAIARTLENTRGNRCGRFWINLAKRIVTMQVGAAYENEVEEAQF
jgi:hypothetical protein